MLLGDLLGGRRRDRSNNGLQRLGIVGLRLRAFHHASSVVVTADCGLLLQNGLYLVVRHSGLRVNR